MCLVGFVTLSVAFVVIFTWKKTRRMNVLEFNNPLVGNTDSDEQRCDEYNELDKY